MPNLRSVAFVFSHVLFIVSSVMMIPAIVELAAGHNDADVYAVSAFIPLIAGGLIFLSTRGADTNLDQRQVYILTSASWFLIPLFAAPPFMLSELNLGFADAYFEAVSGLTTTGATVISGLDDQRPGILIWRSLLQWIGGVGIIVMAVAVLPFLRVGGMQLLHSEFSDRSEKILPQARQLTAYIVGVYFLLSIACAIAYFATGLSGWQAINHAMTTVATGGFSTKDQSIGAFGPAAQWVAIVFMASGAIPFVVYIALMRGTPGRIVPRAQLPAFFGLVALATIALTLHVWIDRQLPLSEALRHSLLNVTSVVTTTGYASLDYQLWGGFALSLFFVLTLIGGCTGSTSGGMKIFRWQILTREVLRNMRAIVRPHRIMPRRYAGKPVNDRIVLGVATFFFLYLMSIGIVSIALGAFGLDLVTAVSGAATAISNVGPGLGPIIGPAGNFGALPDGAIWVLSFAMLLGRLELITLLVVLDPDFWSA